jgi:hypothetical protein
MGHMLLLILETHTNIQKNQKKLEKQKKIEKVQKNNIYIYIYIYIYIKQARS